MIPIPDDHPVARDMARVVTEKIAPEIAKAFHFNVTRMETLHLGCYEGAKGG